MLGQRLRAISSASGGGGGGGLDSQTVTTGASGLPADQDRRRGYASYGLGSITDGTSDIYSGAAITEMYWNEGEGLGSTYVLSITGATDSGWTTITIGSVTLYRSAASFFLGTWTWNTAHTAGAQAFGSGGNVKTVTFA